MKIKMLLFWSVFSRFEAGVVGSWRPAKKGSISNIQSRVVASLSDEAQTRQTQRTRHQPASQPASQPAHPTRPIRTCENPKERVNAHVRASKVNLNVVAIQVNFTALIVEDCGWLRVAGVARHFVA